MKRVFTGLPEFKIAASVFINTLNELEVKYNQELVDIKLKHPEVNSFNNLARMNTADYALGGLVGELDYFAPIYIPSYVRKSIEEVYVNLFYL